MFHVYTEKDHLEYTRSLVGEFSDYEDAMDCAEQAIEGKPNLRYIVVETGGHFNSYGELASEVVAESN